MTTFEDKMKKVDNEKVKKDRKFFVFSTYGEIADVAYQLQQEGEDVVLYVPNPDYKSIGDGIVEKAENWHEYLGKDYIWCIDGCENAKLQDWLRKRGEAVVGTNEALSEYENDRQLGQELFKKAGFKQPESHNFTDFDEAISFVQEHSDKRWILKQNGDAPKGLNHMGKFDKGVDMLFHLEELKKSWNENEFGEVDFDLMEVVEGVEIAVSAFFNGHDWLRNSEGKVVGFLNGEEKKSDNGGLGETCGETGTTFIGVTEDDETFADVLLRPEITALLKEHEYHGVFDINGSITDEGYVAFEPTSRFGVPATSYEFIEGLKTSTADLLEAMARGKDTPIEIHEGIGMVMVISAKPFPLETDNIDNDSTSLGKHLWILKNGKPVDDLSEEQWKHIHFENIKKDDEGDYRVASKSGYILTVTGRGETIKDIRDSLIEYIKDNLYLEGFKYRTDIGERLEEYL